jgi:hypothetical protein
MKSLPDGYGQIIKVVGTEIQTTLDSLKRI